MIDYTCVHCRLEMPNRPMLYQHLKVHLSTDVKGLQMKQREFDENSRSLKVNIPYNTETTPSANTSFPSAKVEIPSNEATSIVINGVQITKPRKKSQLNEAKMMEMEASIHSDVSLNEDVSMLSAEYMVEEDRDMDSSFDTSIDTNLSITSEDRALFNAKEAEMVASQQENEQEPSNRQFSIEELRKEAIKEPPVERSKENVDAILARYSHLDIKISPKKVDPTPSSPKTQAPVRNQNLVREVDTSVEKLKTPKMVKKDGGSRMSESIESSTKKKEGVPCDICQKVLSSKANLKRHLLTHSKQKNN